MNNKRFQILRLSRLFFGISLFALVVFLVMPSWNHFIAEDKTLNAQRQAEVLGYQVFEIYREAARSGPHLNSEKGSRSPASVASSEDLLPLRAESGSIGSDPWGQPYRYKILNAFKDQLKVQIWSAGANRKFETADQPGLAAEKYLGDDVGIVLSMSSKALEN